MRRSSSQQMNIVLLGYRGSGKTTVGKIVASRLKIGFTDTDELLVNRAGKSIKEIFEKHGEEYFRELETAAITEAMALKNQVVALGGGAIKRTANQDLITASDVYSFYLHCDPVELHRRIH